MTTPETDPESSDLGTRRESRWSTLGTEQRNAGSENLDQLGSEDVVKLLLEEDRAGLACAINCSREVAQAGVWFAEAYGSGGTILFAGAGTSGRLGVLEAAECPPTFNSDPERIRAIIAGGPEAVFRSQEGAEDLVEDGAAGAIDLAAGDLLIGLSASSVTPFVRGAIEESRSNGCRTVLVTCASSSGLEGVADLVVALDTGAEVLTGSTRLKAGSATKAVLNAISTSAMVRLGKVYGNLMVDVQPSCAKLEDRAVRIVGGIGGVSEVEAARLLKAAGGRVKVAVVMAMLGVSVEDAVVRLESFGGGLRAALEG